MIKIESIVTLLAMGLCLIAVAAWIGLVLVYLVGLGKVLRDKFRARAAPARGIRIPEPVVDEAKSASGFPAWLRVVLGCFSLSWACMLVALIPIIIPILPHAAGPMIYGLAAFCASLGLACLFRRTQPVTLRIVGLLIFYVCVSYVLDMIGEPLDEDKPNIAKALAALGAFGLPGAFLAVGGWRGLTNWFYILEKYVIPFFHGEVGTDPDDEDVPPFLSRSTWGRDQAGSDGHRPPSNHRADGVVIDETHDFE